jgi:hypothetical protein
MIQTFAMVCESNNENIIHHLNLEIEAYVLNKQGTQKRIHIIISNLIIKPCFNHKINVQQNAHKGT